MTEQAFGRYAKDLLTTLYNGCKTAFDEKATNDKKERAYSDALFAKGQLVGAVICSDIYQPKYQGFLVMNIGSLDNERILKHDSAETFADSYLKEELKIDLSEEQEDDEECEL